MISLRVYNSIQNNLEKNLGGKLFAFICHATKAQYVTIKYIHLQLFYDHNSVKCCYAFEIYK